MEFDFIVSRYRKNYKQAQRAEHIYALAGFNSLEEAQRYVEYRTLDFFSSGFFFIASPQGKHIHGYDSKGHVMWYPPDKIEKAIVFDARKDAYIDIGSFMPVWDWYDFMKKNSVLTKIKDYGHKQDSERTSSAKNREDAR